MRKRDLLELIKEWDLDDEVRAALSPDLDRPDLLEAGAVLDVVDGGQTASGNILILDRPSGD